MVFNELPMAAVGPPEDATNSLQHAYHEAVRNQQIQNLSLAETFGLCHVINS
jgi:hypothetical protein